MRIATWNLERGGRTLRARAAQEETLRALSADVMILTEPPPTYSGRPGVVTSPPLRDGPKGGESWVAIVGVTVEALPFDVPYERLAVAARARVAGVTVIVYGAVLPWRAVTNHAPYLVRDGENAPATFARVLAEHVADIARLRALHEAPVIWAGDFNQSVAGPNLGGSVDGRTRLTTALAELGYGAWNGTSPHAQSGLCSVDLICGPAGREPAYQGRIDRVSGEIVMSDHAGYWIEL